MSDIFSLMDTVSQGRSHDVAPPVTAAIRYAIIQFTLIRLLVTFDRATKAMEYVSVVTIHC